MTTKRSKLVSLSDEPILRKQVLKDLAALKRKITVTLRKIARLNRKPQVTTKRSKKPVSFSDESMLATIKREITTAERKIAALEKKRNGREDGN